MKFAKMIALVVVFAMVLGIMAGCGGQQAATAKEEPKKADASEAKEEPKKEETKKDEAKKKIKIGVTMQGLDSPYVVTTKKYVDEAIKALGDQVEATVLDGQSNAEKQVSQAENFIAQKVDAIIMNPISFDGCAPAVTAASKAGIPLVTLITLVNSDKVSSHSGSDHKESGIIEAEAVAKYLNGKGNVVVLEGVMGIDAQIKRLEGYKEVFAKYPGIKIVAQNTAAWQRDKALSLVENWLQSGKQFDVVLAENDNMAMGALKAVEDHKLLDKIKVFGIDGDNDALQAVKDGRLQATVFQDAKGQAYQAVEAAMKLARKEPVEKQYIIPFKLVTKENINDFLK